MISPGNHNGPVSCTQCSAYETTQGVEKEALFGVKMHDVIAAIVTGPV